MYKNQFHAGTLAGALAEALADALAGALAGAHAEAIAKTQFGSPARALFSAAARLGALANAWIESPARAFPNAASRLQAQLGNRTLCMCWRLFAIRAQLRHSARRVPRALYLNPKP